MATPQHSALTSDCAEENNAGALACDCAEENNAGALTCDCAGEVNHLDQTNEAQAFLERLATDDAGLFLGISPVRFFIYIYIFLPQGYYLGNWEE